MSRGLKFLAAVIGTLMVVMPFAGLDSLPGEVRARIEAERRAQPAAEARVRQARQEVVRNLEAEPELFAAIPDSRQWQAGLRESESELQSAAHGVAQLTALGKENDREDRAQAEALLSRQRQLRAAAVKRASEIQTEAARWVELKRALPATLERMERDYRNVRDFDYAPVTATVGKAGADWPARKGDLETRLGRLRDLEVETGRVWQSAADARRRAAAGQFAGLDFPALIAAADTLRNAAATLPRDSDELNSLSSQLYTAWDKVLVDLDRRRRAQKIRTITTKDGATTSDERWVEVPRQTYEAMQANLGMAIEHKAAGKYDSEAERTAQPAGFAYVARPGERNEYGYWDRRDGRDFWVFYGQYAILRDLLFNRDYRPLDRGDWENYRTSRDRGQTYYGQDRAKPQYGTKGATTERRYSGSTYDRGGGFRDSKYATKSGSYRDSEFASPSARDPKVDGSPRRFGRDAEASPPPSRSYRPAPRPTPRPSSSGPGKRFGKR